MGTRVGVRSALLSLLMLTGCGLSGCAGAAGDSEETGGSAMTIGSGGATAAGGAGSGTAAVVCGVEPELVVGETMVLVSDSDEPLPPPVGGPLVDGTYDLASWVFHGSPGVDLDGLDLREVIRLREGGRALDTRLPISDVSTLSVGPVAPGAVSLELAETCPRSGNVGPLDYSAPPGQLVFYSQMTPDSWAVATFVLRQ